MLIPAAGIGTRIGSELPKQYLKLNGSAMINHTITAFLNTKRITKVYVLISPTDSYWQIEGLQENDRLEVIRCGGETRAQTVRNGLAAVSQNVYSNDWILVHDAARPCISPYLINKLIDELKSDEVGGLLAMPIADTVKKESKKRVEVTVPREHLWVAQTPQMFRYQLLKNALDHVGENISTDESQAIEALGKSPKLVVGHASNFKVTFSDDVSLAEIILQSKIESTH